MRLVDAKPVEDLALQAWRLPLVDRFIAEYPQVPPAVVAEQVQLVARGLWAAGAGDDVREQAEHAVRSNLDTLTVRAKGEADTTADHGRAHADGSL